MIEEGERASQNYDWQISYVCSATSVMTIHFFTVATENVGYFNEMLESCTRHDISMTVLGMGQKWEGFVWKWKLVLRSLLQATHIADEDFVGVVDAYDLVFVGTPAEMLQKIISAGAENKITVASDGQA